MVSQKFVPPSPPVGIIESLTSGFEAAASHLPLLLVPLFVDLFLWTGPRLTWRTIFAEGARGLQTWSEQGGSGTSEVDKDFVKWVEDQATSAPNLYLPVWMLPSIFNGRDASPLPTGYTPPIVDSPMGVATASALSFGSGLILWGIYVGLIAAQIKRGDGDFWRIMKGLPGFLFQFTLLMIVLTVIVAALLFFMLLFFSILAVLGLNLVGNPQAGSFLGALTLFMIVIPAGAFVTFTVNGMLLNQRNVVAAMWDSTRVIQWNTQVTLGLFYLIFMLNFALGYVWSIPSTGSWLTLAAIGANAFISTGLVAATFVFYKDRYRYWQEMREKLLAELEKQRIHQNGN